MRSSWLCSALLLCLVACNEDKVSAHARVGTAASRPSGEVPVANMHVATNGSVQSSTASRAQLSSKWESILIAKLMLRDLSPEDQDSIEQAIARSGFRGEGVAAESLRGRVKVVESLVDEALMRVESGASEARDFPNALCHLARCLQQSLGGAREQMNVQIEKLRGPDYLALVKKEALLKVRAAQLDGGAAESLRDLREEVLRQIGSMDDQAERCEVARVRLAESAQEIEDAIARWSNSGLISPTSIEECKILKTEFQGIVGGL